MTRFLPLSISCSIVMAVFLCSLSPLAHASAPSPVYLDRRPEPGLILPLNERPSWDVTFRHTLSNGEKETTAMSAANASSALSSRLTMGTLRLAREYSLLPELEGNGFSYALGHKKSQLQAHVLKDDTRYSSRQITGASMNVGLPLGSSVSVSAFSGSETSASRALTSQVVLMKGTFARPVFQLNGEVGMSMLDSAHADRASDKAYRISGQGQFLGIHYDGMFEYTGPRYRFLSRSVQQPDTRKKTLRARRETPIGGVRLSLMEVETNVDANPGYTGSFQRLAEIEYSPKLLWAIPATLLFRKGEAGFEAAGGGAVPTSKIDAAGGTIEVAMDPVDVKVKTVHTWVRDYETSEGLSKEMVLEVSPQLHLRQIQFEPTFSVQRRQDIPFDAVHTVYDIDFLLRKKPQGSKTRMDIACGYTGRSDNRSGGSDTYRSRVGVTWLPKNLPFSFTRSNVSLAGEYTREKYIWDQARNGYSFMVTFELS